MRRWSQNGRVDRMVAAILLVLVACVIEWVRKGKNGSGREKLVRIVSCLRA